MQMRQKLGPEDWSRISQRAAAVAEAALQQSLLGEMQRDSNSPAGALQIQVSCPLPLLFACLISIYSDQLLLVSPQLRYSFLT